MTTILNSVLESFIKDKPEEKKNSLYRSLIDLNTPETYVFFLLFENALNDLVQCMYLETLLKNTLKSIKNCDVNAKLLLPKIIEVYLKYQIKMPTLTASGWKALSDNTKICYEYIKARKTKLNPTMNNLEILNNVRKHNIHICDNHILHWVNTNTLKIFTENYDHDTLITFFSKLSNKSIKLIISNVIHRLSNTHIDYSSFFSIVCNKTLDKTDVTNIFKIFDMSNLFDSTKIYHYFEYINDMVLAHYYNTISNDKRPPNVVVTHFQNTVRNLNKISDNYKNKIIDFALFFHMKKDSRETLVCKEHYAPIFRSLIPFFTPTQMLLLHEKFINEHSLRPICEEHFDILIKYVRNIGTKTNVKSRRVVKEEEEEEEDSDYTIDEIEEEEEEEDSDYTVDYIEEQEYYQEEIRRRSNTKTEKTSKFVESQEPSDLYVALVLCNIEAFKAVNVCQLINEEYTENEKKELITCIATFCEEKHKEMICQIKKSFRMMSHDLFLTFDELYEKESIVNQIYLDSIQFKLKKFKVDPSMITIDPNMTKNDMVLIIFDKSDDPAGLCKICYDKIVNISCKKCGNCMCDGCYKGLKYRRCHICSNSLDILKLHL